jgi:hypothetical protein
VKDCVSVFVDDRVPLEVALREDVSVPVPVADIVLLPVRVPDGVGVTVTE